MSLSVGLHYQYLYLRIFICVFVYLYAVKYIVVVGSVLVCRTTLLIESAVHLSNKLLSIKSPFGQIALFLSTDLPHDIRSVRTFSFLLDFPPKSHRPVWHQSAWGCDRRWGFWTWQCSQLCSASVMMLCWNVQIWNDSLFETNRLHLYFQAFRLVIYGILLAYSWIEYYVVQFGHGFYYKKNGVFIVR